jgi:AcrR family transcriptional regulator
MADWQDELREQRRSAILEAAADIFAQKGYHRATIKEIAAAVGIAPGTIYLYFKDKRDLLLSIAERLVHAVPDTSIRASRAQEPGLLQQLLEERITTMHKYWPFIRVLAGEMWVDRDLREQYLNKVMAPTLNAFEQQLEAYAKQEHVRSFDPYIIARAMLGAVTIFILTSEITPADIQDDARRRAIIRELSGFFLYGLRGMPQESEGEA